MKIHGFVVIMVAVAFAFAPAKLSAQGHYAVKLTSPVAGQVLYAGQKIMIEWKHRLPNIPLAGCESEAWLSLDGGRTFYRVDYVSRPREVHLSSGLFRTRLQIQLSLIFVSGATCIIPKATLPSLHRCSPSRRRTKFCLQDQRVANGDGPRI